MDPRFLDDLRREAYALSEEAVPFLERQLTADDRKTIAGLQRTAAQTRLTTLLMDAVAWLALLTPQRPAQRSMRLATRVGVNEDVLPDDLDPDLADLMRRVVSFHRRLEHIETRLDSGFCADTGNPGVSPALVSSSSDAPRTA